MKKRLILIALSLCIICCVSFSCVFTANAQGGFSDTTDITIKPLDFGDQNDYDTDSGSDWGSSDYDYDYDYDDDDDYGYNYNDNDSYGSYSHSSRDYDDYDFVDLIIGVAIIAIIILCIYGSTGKKKNNKNNKNKSNNIKQNAGRNVILPDRTNEITKIIHESDPNFSAEDFNAFARFVYVTIQDAWSKRDLDPVRLFLHDNLYNQTNQQVKNKIARGVVNKIENVAVSTAYLTSYCKDSKLEHIGVYLNARLTDYEIDEKTGKVLRGNPNARYELRYILKFVRNAGVKTNEINADLKTHNCPNCGAPLEMSSSGKCEYCDSVITTGEYTWVLSEYSSIRNDTVDQGIYIEGK